jgi:hypothetical protein
VLVQLNPTSFFFTAQRLLLRVREASERMHRPATALHSALNKSTSTNKIERIQAFIVSTSCLERLDHAIVSKFILRWWQAHALFEAISRLMVHLLKFAI